MIPQSRISRLGTLDRKWKLAEHAWQGELDRLFGALAHNVRLSGGGEGEPGTELSARHGAFIAARDAYLTAMNRL